MCPSTTEHFYVFYRTDITKFRRHYPEQMNDSEFQRWTTLAQQSPAEFEAQRRQALLEAAASMPERQQPMLRTLAEALCTPCRCNGMERFQHAQTLLSESLFSMQDAWADLTTTLVVDRIRSGGRMRD